jgi:hypothetical protein
MQASKFCRLEMSWAGADLELAKTAVSRCCFGRHAAAVLLGNIPPGQVLRATRVLELGCLVDREIVHVAAGMRAAVKLVSRGRKARAHSTAVRDARILGIRTSTEYRATSCVECRR